MIGTLKDYAGNKSITAFKVRPVTDHNELTYHLMSTIYQRVNLTKAPKVVTVLNLYIIYYCDFHALCNVYSTICCMHPLFC